MIFNTMQHVVTQLGTRVLTILVLKSSCTRFNIFRKKFPQVMFSSIFGFSIDAQLWEIEEDSMRDSPGVKLD